MRGEVQDGWRDVLLTVDEVAHILKVTPATVRTWLRGRKLHGISLGNRKPWRVRVTEVERFLTERQA